MTGLIVVILTRNEARHILRAIGSVRGLGADVVVVDSGSTDDTVALARQAGAQVLQNPWTNHATQFNWALDQIAGRSDWVMRLDADEVVTEALADQIAAGLPNVDGIYVGRSMCFLGQPVRHGGLFPIRVLRLFRNGAGRCEQRWMDEHIVVTGKTATLSGQIIDDNGKPLDWWVAKHNAYASREVIDILNRQYGFLPYQSIASLKTGRPAEIKRWIKENIYGRFPCGLRAGLYFQYRYVLRLGFLDGAQGRSFHVLQGFWYRYLVDAKLAEVRRYMAATGAPPIQAISDILEVDLQRQDLQPRQVTA